MFNILFLLFTILILFILWSHFSTNYRLKNENQVGVVLVLSGGGARGFAHAGVISVLEKNGVPIDAIVGTSAGGIVGACYADSLSSEELFECAQVLITSGFTKISIKESISAITSVSGLDSGNKLEKMLKSILRSRTFDDLKIPVAVVATNIRNGKAKVFTEGDLIPILKASSALPLYFKPVTIGEEIYVDGSAVAFLPVREARDTFKSKIVIAVNTSVPTSNGKIKNTIDLLKRVFIASMYNIASLQEEKADLVIHPDVSECKLLDESKGLLSYDKGVEATERMLPEILELLRLHKIPLNDKSN